MIRLLLGAAVACLLAASASAQQPDPAFMQKTIAALQAQRNEAMDWRAALEAKLSLVTDENAKLQARIKELEATAPKAEPDQK